MVGDYPNHLHNVHQFLFQAHEAYIFYEYLQSFVFLLIELFFQVFQDNFSQISFSCISAYVYCTICRFFGTLVLIYTIVPSDQFKFYFDLFFFHLAEIRPIFTCLMIMIIIILDKQKLAERISTNPDELVMFLSHVVQCSLYCKQFSWKEVTLWMQCESFGSYLFIQS